MNFAEQLKNQLDIVEVVGQYVRLKRQGAGPRYVGLCPFHSEKTASFGVHSSLQYYKCFGCDAAGDVLNFVQQMETLTFPETLRLLAERYGIAMPERQRMDDPEARRTAEVLEAHDAAATVFQDNLRSTGGAEARNYLESRGVDAPLMSEFRLGLSDSSGQQLVQRLKNFGETLLVESGLIMKRQEGNGYFDRFRGRLMFPIHDESGRVIAFGGRALRKGDEPKYLNSPETRVYKKSSVLYNLHRAKIAARKNNRMILVEGYMDVIGVYSAGVQEVVATCGTALGNPQVRIIKRQISQQSQQGQVILNFDPDPAGARSTEKYIASLLAEGLRVKVLEIPAGLDPDEFIQQNGSGGYTAILEKAPSYFQWLTERSRGRFDMRTAEGRIDAFKLILPAIEQVQDRLERATIATEVAEQLNVNREAVSQALRRSQSSPGAQPSRQISSALPPNEKLLIACLLASRDARGVIRHYLANGGSLEGLELRTIFDAILSAENAAGSFSLSDVTASLDTRSQRMLTEISFSDSGVTEADAAQQALHCLRALETKSVAGKREALRKKIRELESAGDIAGALRLTDELDTLGRSSQAV